MTNDRRAGANVPAEYIELVRIHQSDLETAIDQRKRANAAVAKAKANLAAIGVKTSFVSRITSKIKSFFPWATSKLKRLTDRLSSKKRATQHRSRVRSGLVFRVCVSLLIALVGSTMALWALDKYFPIENTLLNIVFKIAFLAIAITMAVAAALDTREKESP